MPQEKYTYTNVTNVYLQFKNAYKLSMQVSTKKESNHNNIDSKGKKMNAGLKNENGQINLYEKKIKLIITTEYQNTKAKVTATETDGKKVGIKN